MNTVDTQNTVPPGRHLRVARLGSREAEALARLESACFSTATSHEGFLEAFASIPAFQVYGLLDGDRLDAYVSLYRTGDEIEIINIGVDPVLRRQGLGSCLLSTVLASAFESGVTKAFLDVSTENTAALALYGKLGFTEIGRRKGYYRETGADALLYCLDSKNLYVADNMKTDNLCPGGQVSATETSQAIRRTE